MNTVNLRGLVLDEGRPKICLPIVGKTIAEIEAGASEIIKHKVDIVEWRADWYEAIANANQDSINAVAAKIKKIIGEIPLLFTIRTSNEGGELEVNFESYSKLVLAASKCDSIDAVDVEILISDTKNVTSLIASAKENAVVIASSHDFDKTPECGVITDRLKYMEKCGADVCKMAVMPRTMEDVLTLLDATNKASQIINAPVITMSMGKYGLISRLAGESFGSCLTFGCVGKASAPGQIDADDLYTVLDIIHKNVQ